MEPWTRKPLACDVFDPGGDRRLHLLSAMIPSGNNKNNKGQAQQLTKNNKGQAQQLTDLVIPVNFVDCSGSLSWGSYCDYLPFSTCGCHCKSLVSLYFSLRSSGSSVG